MLDVLVRGAMVFAGDSPGQVTDVGVEDGKIAAVGSLAHASAAEAIDGTGLWLCPGFIDMHTHSALISFQDPYLTPKLAQGFTTEVICPDGLAPAPVSPERRRERQAYLRPLEGNGPDEWPWSTLEQYLDALDASRPALSLVPSIGHGAVRDLVLGGGRVAPTGAQLAEMAGQVRIGLDAGARMLSFGLVYFPGAFAETEELIAVAREAARVGAPLVPHVRNEGEGVLKAVFEMIDVARRAGAPLHLSHLKAASGSHLVGPLLKLLDRSAVDVDLTFDQYPYGAGSTLLASLLPAWAQEGGASATLAALADREAQRRIAHDIEHGLPGWENQLGMLGPENVQIAHAAPPYGHAIGKTLALVAEELSVDPVAAVLELISGTQLDVTMIVHYASDEDVRRVAAHPLQLVGSDGIFGPRAHPRVYATAPRFLGRFAIRERVLQPEEAIARLTARAADRLGLGDRGRIAPGKRADLVLLDPDTYVDTATYADPARAPEGVAAVWVAGTRVWRDGAPTDERPGGVVR